MLRFGVLLASAISSAAATCTRDNVTFCAAAAMTDGSCLCTQCEEHYVLGTHGTLCEREIIVRCGGEVSDARHTCTENAFANSVGNCTCYSNYKCIPEGECRDTTCAGRDSSCLAYDAPYENGDGVCQCSRCQDGYALSGGNCYLSLTCGARSRHASQCPSSSTRDESSGICVCPDTHVCSRTSGGCVPKAWVACNLPIDPVHQRCVESSSPVEGVCVCADGLWCQGGACHFEELLCGDTVTQPYQRCAPGGWLAERGRVCTCADDVHYTCAADKKSCDLTLCTGGGGIEGCELVWREPVKGACVCRRCQISLMLKDGLCIVANTQTPVSPVSNIMKIGFIHDLKPSELARGMSMLKAQLMAVRMINTGGSLLQLNPVIVDTSSSTKSVAQLAEDLVDEHRVDAIVGCSTAECRDAVFAVADARGVPFVNAAVFDADKCSGHFYSVGPTPNQLVGALTTYAMEISSHHFLILHEGGDFEARIIWYIKILLDNMVGFLLEPIVLFADTDTLPFADHVLDSLPDRAVLVNLLSVSSAQRVFPVLRARQAVRNKDFLLVSPFLDEEGVKTIGADVMAGSISVSSFYQTTTNPLGMHFVKNYVDPILNTAGDYADVKAADTVDLTRIEYASGLLATDLAESSYSAVLVAAEVFIDSIGKGPISIPWPQGFGIVTSTHYTRQSIHVATVQADGSFHTEVVTEPLGVLSLYDDKLTDTGVFACTTVTSYTRCRRTEDCGLGQFCNFHSICRMQPIKCDAVMPYPELQECRDNGAIPVVVTTPSPDGIGVVTNTLCKCQAGRVCEWGGCVVAPERMNDFFHLSFVISGLDWSELVTSAGSPTAMMHYVHYVLLRGINKNADTPLEDIHVRRICLRAMEIVRPQDECVFANQLKGEHEMQRATLAGNYMQILTGASAHPLMYRLLPTVFVEYEIASAHLVQYELSPLVGEGRAERTLLALTTPACLSHFSPHP